jgi:Ran GTPase-activating protein (RanGAP) involved in mRNA processing and transport
MYPARQFQVVSSFNSGNQLRIIHVKEIQPPFPLIHIPPTTSTTSVDRSKEIEPSLSVMHISQPSAPKTTYQNKQLEQLIAQCEDRSTIDLKKQNLTDEDMEILVREAIINKQCKQLELSKNKITSVGASIIAKALNNNTTLEVLYFTDNRFGDMGAKSLTQTLSLNNSKIVILDVQDTGITDEGASYLAEMLKTNKKLRSLLLSYNEISDRGVQHLANVITHHNTTLVQLFVGRHKLVSDLSVDTLVEMLKHNQTLEYLKITECNLSEKGKERLRQLAKSKEGFKLEL